MVAIAALVLGTGLLCGVISFGSGGYLNGDCQLVDSNGKEVPLGDWLYDHFLHPHIPDTSPADTEVGRFTANNIQAITSRQSKYIKPELKDGYLVLTLNEDFKHFEEWETEPDITIELVFQCRDGSGSILIRSEVVDSNNHSPEFVGSLPFEYALALPFPPNVPLSCVTGVVVAATDIDLSTTRIDFAFTDTDALAVAGFWKVGRVYHANVSTTRYITAPFSATLRATDNGEPPLSAETKLQVLADTRYSLQQTLLDSSDSSGDL